MAAQPSVPTSLNDARLPMTCLACMNTTNGSLSGPGRAVVETRGNVNNRPIEYRRTVVSVHNWAVDAVGPNSTHLLQEATHYGRAGAWPGG